MCVGFQRICINPKLGSNSSSEAIRTIRNVYGDESISNRLKDGLTSVDTDPCSGTTAIDRNRHLTARKLEEGLGIAKTGF